MCPPIMTATQRALRTEEARVAVVSSFEEFLSLEDEWNALLDEARIEHPFLTHEWIRSWWEAFRGEARLNILLARAGGRLIGIAPLMSCRRRFYRLEVRCLETIANAHTPRSDFVVSPARPDAWNALWNHVASRDGEWDILRLAQLAQGSTTYDMIGRLAEGKSYLMGTWPSNRSPYIDPAGGSWADYLASLGKKHRSNLRNRMAKLESLGSVRFERLTDPAEVASSLEESFRLEGAAWKAAAGTAILSDGGTRHFYETLSRRAARRRWMELSFLDVGGKRIAAHYALRYAGRLYLLKPGYDPRYHRLSPGTLLTQRVLERAFEDGMKWVDFAGNDDAWKQEWTRRTLPYAWLYVFPPRIRPSLIHGIKFWLAPRIRGTMRALRRRSDGDRSWP